MDEKKKQGTLNGDTKNENGGHKNDELKNLIAGYVAEAIKNRKSNVGKRFFRQNRIGKRGRREDGYNVGRGQSKG